MTEAYSKNMEERMRKTRYLLSVLLLVSACGSSPSREEIQENMIREVAKQYMIQEYLRACREVHSKDYCENTL